MGQPKVDKLTKIFNNGKNSGHVVLHDLCFSVKEGSFCLYEPGGE